MSTRAVGGPLDAATMRTSNLSLVLRHLHTSGDRTRARIAQETGLSKAATTSIIAELADRGLVREGASQRSGSRGRPGIEVGIAPGRAAGIGVEISVDYTAVVALDLAGTVLHRADAPHPDGEGAEAVVDQVGAQLRAALAALDEAHVVPAGITIAPPGVIDYAQGAVRFAPNLGWVDLPLLEEVRRRAPAARDLPIELENDAKLSALSSFPRHAARGVRDLVFLTGDVGVGAGIIANGQIVRGRSGFSGEVGHMRVESPGLACRCGRRGCWETRVGLEALLAPLPASVPARDAHLDLPSRLQDVEDRLARGDGAATAAFAAVREHLAHGIGLLVDVLNPQVLVLGGYFGRFADRLVTDLSRELDARALDSGGRVEIVPAHLGLDSAATGGAIAALGHVLSDPALVPHLAAAS